MDANSFSWTEEKFISKLQKIGIPFLRFSLGIVFLWFGALKVLGVSPVEELVTTVYSFLPASSLMILLGLIECVIGLGLIFKINLKLILPVLWIQMAGTFLSLFLLPSRFFMNGNPLLLTTEGEFIMKNLVLIAASMVVGGFEVRPGSDLWTNSNEEGGIINSNG